MRHTKSRFSVMVLGLALVALLLAACTAPAAPAPAAPTKAPAAAAPTKAPAAAPTTAPAATKAPAAATTAPAATKAPAASTGSLGPMPALQPTTMQWAAGGVGGGWYQLSAGIAELVKQEVPNLQINVVPGAGIANHLRVAQGEVPLAMGFPSVAKALMNGTEPFKAEDKTDKISAVIGGFGETYLTFAVQEDVDAESFEDFVQKKLPLKIAVDRVGTTDEWSLRLALSHYGLTYDDIRSWGGSVTFTGYADQATNMKDRHVDAIWENIAAPSPTIQDVMTSRKIKVLPLSDAVIKDLVENTGFADHGIPAGRYGDKEIPSVASITTLMASPDAPEDAVYVLTRVVNENADKVRTLQQSAADFDPSAAWKDTGAPLHPGAEKYYKEKGYMP